MKGPHHGRLGRVATAAFLVVGLTGCTATSATNYLAHMPDHERRTDGQTPGEIRHRAWQALPDQDHCLTYEDFFSFVEGGRHEWMACDQTHFAQLFPGGIPARMDDPLAHSDDYPGEEMAVAIGEAECMAGFDEWAGVPFEDTILDFMFILIDPEHWDQRPRPAFCFAIYPSSTLSSDVMGSGDAYPLRAESGEPEAPIEVSSRKLRTGDCIQDSTGFGLETIVPCDVPHGEQVSAVFDLPDGEFPGEDEIHQIADDECLDRFATYIGEDYEYSTYYTYAYAPAEEYWNVGDRSIQCRVYDPTGDIEGSLAGTGEGRTDTTTTTNAATSELTAKSFLM